MSNSAAVARLHDVQPAVLGANNELLPVDVAAEMDAAVGDISGMEISGEQLLVGVYCRGNILKNGFIVPNMVKEDIWQGKVSRILKLGSGIGDKQLHCCGERPLQVGDWIFNRVEDSFQLSVKGVGSVPSRLFEEWKDILPQGGWPCRLIYLSDIYGRLSEPRLIV